MSRINDFNQLFPRAVDKNGMKRFDICRRCGAALTGRRTSFCSKKCAELSLIETNPHSYRHITLKYLSPICAVCGEDKTTRKFSGWFKAAIDIHHIIPVAEGGTNELKNLVGLCHGCHVAIHALRKTMQMWIDGKIEWPDKKQMVLF